MSFRHHARAFALRGLLYDGDADGRQCAEAAEASSERDGIVDRAAAGIQHDGRAAELASRANSSNSCGLSAVTMPTAKPTLRGGLAFDPSEVHQRLRSSKVPPAYAELPSVVIAPGKRLMQERRRRGAPCREF